MAGRGLGTLTLNLAVATGGFEAGLGKAERLLDKRARDMQKRATAMGKAIGLALVGAASAIAYGVKAAIDQADALNDLNVRLGISAEALSGWAYAAKQSGTDIEGLSVGLKKLAKNMAEALNPKSAPAKLFAALDVSPIDKATGKLKTLEQILPEISDKFKQLHDDTLEAALAQELFGSSDLLEFLNLGSSGIDDLRAKLRSLGGELSESTLKAADEFNDKLGDLKTASDGLFTALASDLLPQLTDLVDSLIEASKEGSELRSVIHGLAEFLAYLGDVAKDVDNIWRGLVSSFIALQNASEGIAKLNPMGYLSNWIKGGDSIADSFGRAKTAAEQALEAFKNYGKEYQHGTAEKLVPATDSHPFRILPKASGLEKRLQDALGGGSGGGSEHHGKSQAQQDAEQLEQAFERMNAQMAETISLYNQTGEAAKVRYEIEHGELAKLSDAKKAELLQQAEQIDQLAEEKKAREDAIRLEEQETKAAEEHAKQVKELLDDIAFETSLTKLSNDEKERAILLRRNLAGATEEEAARITAATDEMLAAQRSSNELSGAMDEFRQNFEDSVVDVVTGAKSISDAFKSLADAVIAQIARIIAQQLTTSLFGAPGSTGGGSQGGWLSSLFGIFLPAHASGTDFAPGGPSIVGEHGPEIVNLPRGSQVIPNHKIGGASVTVNINGGSNPRETALQAAREVRRILAFSGRS